MPSQQSNEYLHEALWVACTHGGFTDDAETEAVSRWALAEIERLRAWIDTEGRNCPSNTTIDKVLGKTGERSS